MIYLHSLKIQDYKQLKGFKLSFQQKGHKLDWLTLLYGINGSGKSTILECLTLIFRALNEKYEMRRKVELPFEFKLKYWICSSAQSKITELDTLIEANSKIVDGKYTIALFTKLGDSGKVEHKLHDREAFATILPNQVVYYSGLSETIKTVYESYENRYLRELRNNAKRDNAAYSRVKRLPLFYLRQRDVGILTAALYGSPYNQPLVDFFNNVLNIKQPDTDCIELRFRGHTTLSDLLSQAKEDYLGLFFRKLDSHKSGQSYSFIGGTVLTFSLAGWNELREEFGTEQDLLTLLILLRAQGQLRDITVKFERQNTNGKEYVLPHMWLSEGEQQLLTIRALSELLVRENTLLLFDEPDTFLHPQWQRQFFDILEPLKDRASCLLTTHSPILLANLKTGNLVHVENGKAVHVPGNPYGQRYADMLTDYMLLDSRPKEQERAVNKVMALLVAEEPDVEKAEIELEVLRQMDGIGENDPDVLRAETMLTFLKH